MNSRHNQRVLVVEIASFIPKAEGALVRINSIHVVGAKEFD